MMQPQTKKRRVLGQLSLATAVLSLTALSFIAVPVPAAAQAAYPNKPIKLVVPFPAGGSTDSIGRLLAGDLSRQLGQQVVVENKAGANGNIGSEQVAKAAPDGYTLLVSGVGSNAINYSLYSKMAYADKDFVHISLLATGPNVLAVNPEFKARTLQELLAMAKANPGKLNYASSGSGSSGNLSMEMLKQAAGVDLVHVPYKGGAPAITDTIANQVPMLFINQDNALPHVKAGKLRAIAVTSVERNPAYPDVPSIAESGFPGFSAVSWFALSAPAGTPPDIVKRLSEASAISMKSADARQHLESVGFVVVGNTPEQAKAFFAAEIDKWGKVVKTSGAKAE